LGPIENLPPGYLFLCPLAEFETHDPAWFVIPDCSAYWSVDSSGVEQLCTEDARTLGFPDINSWIEVQGVFWYSSVYTGIHQFHEAKGFDPDSQDMAMHLGYPLFQIACRREDLIFHCKSQTGRSGFI
jgi:hypothetical protein